MTGPDLRRPDRLRGFLVVFEVWAASEAHLEPSPVNVYVTVARGPGAPLRAVRAGRRELHRQIDVAFISRAARVERLS